MCSSPLLLLLLLPVLSVGELSPVLTRHFLEFHNTVRAEIARGNISHPTFKAKVPKASGMRVLEWWPILHSMAAKLTARRCGGGSATVTPLDKDILVAAVKETTGNFSDSLAELLFRVSEPQIDGKLDFSHPIMDEQMVRLGCDLHNCSKKGERILVCVYASQRIVPLKKGSKPYRHGQPCSDCPTGNNFCVNNVLCATHHQCEYSSSRCDCLIDANKCEEGGGYFDEDNCQCVCQDKHATGLHCEKKCKDRRCKLKTSGGAKPSDCFDDDVASRILITASCKKTCGFCRVDALDSLPRTGARVKTNVYTHMSFLNSTEREVEKQGK